MSIALGTTYNGTTFNTGESPSITVSTGDVVVLCLTGDITANTATFNGVGMTDFGVNPQSGGGVYSNRIYYVGSCVAGTYTLTWTSVSSYYCAQVYHDSGSVNLTVVGAKTDNTGTASPVSVSVARPSANAWGIGFGGMNQYGTLTNITQRQTRLDANQHLFGDSNGVPANPFAWSTNLTGGGDWGVSTFFIDVAPVTAVDMPYQSRLVKPTQFYTPAKVTVSK